MNKVGTFEKMSHKHGYRRIVAKTVVVCRGQSFECLNKKIMSACTQLVIVNDWEHHQPHEFLERYENRNLINFLTDMENRQPRYTLERLANVGKMRAERAEDALKSHRGKFKSLDNAKRAAFYRLWDTGDTGLRAIAIYSLDTTSILIAGLDFWEAPYWISPVKPMPEREFNKKKRAKGLQRKNRYLARLTEWVRCKDDTMFVFVSYSQSLIDYCQKHPIGNCIINPSSVNGQQSGE